MKTDLGVNHFLQLQGSNVVLCKKDGSPIQPFSKQQLTTQKIIDTLHKETGEDRETVKKALASLALLIPEKKKKQRDKTDQLTNLEKQVSYELGHILHPAGGLTKNFVYEPLGTREYVYCTKDGKKGIASLQVEYEDPETKKNPSWKIEVEGKPYYFNKKPPKEWLFNTPDRNLIQKWIDEKKHSLDTKELWNLNNTYLRTFLDFPHQYEFSATLLFIQQTWLVELLPVVFYLGIKGEFGGGKTVTGEAVVNVSRHGYLTGNLSPPFVARAIEDQKITLMVDELDSLAGTKDSDLNSIFRQGYRRGSKYSRVNPDTLESESKEIFGPKLFTVHSDIEEALQTRTIPLHVRETEKPEYPIVNLDKVAFGKLVYAENFLWFLDNILAYRDNDLHMINGLATNLLDILDALDLKISDSNNNIFKISDSNVDVRASEIRAILFKKKKGLISEGQVNQVSQVAGRNTELMFICFTLSNIIKISCDDDIKKTFEQKLIEEGERSELGYLGLLRDVLTELWTNKQNDKENLADYMTEDGFIKISNKETYNKFNEKLKKEYDAGVSPAKFKEYMLTFGFTDALNRKKLEVPIPSDPEKKSRLCNIFTPRVIRKLGIEPLEKTELQKLEEVKKWILTNKKDGIITASELSSKIRELGFDPQRIIQKLKDEGRLFEVTKLNAWGVSK